MLQVLICTQVSIHLLQVLTAINIYSMYTKINKVYFQELHVHVGDFYMHCGSHLSYTVYT